MGWLDGLCLGLFTVDLLDGLCLGLFTMVLYMASLDGLCLGLFIVYLSHYRQK